MAQEDRKMTNTAERTFTTADIKEMVASQIDMRLADQAEKVRVKKAAVKGRLRRTIDFLFSSQDMNPYGIPADMQARMYL